MKLYLKTYSRDLNHQRRTQVYQMDGRHNPTTSKRIAEAIVKRENNSLSGGFVTAYQLVRDGGIVYEHRYPTPTQEELPLESPIDEYLRAKGKRELGASAPVEQPLKAILRLLEGARFTVNLQSSTTKAATEPVDCTTFNITINITENSNG